MRDFKKARQNNLSTDSCGEPDLMPVGLVSCARSSLEWDLTGAGIWFAAKTSPGANTVIFQKSVGSGITVTDAACGAGMIELVPSDTQWVRVRTARLYFDMDVEAAGAIYTVAAGRLVVEPDLTVRP
jgi:hypothetical protein